MLIETRADAVTALTVADAATDSDADPVLDGDIATERDKIGDRLSLALTDGVRVPLGPDAVGKPLADGDAVPDGESGRDTDARADAESMLTLGAGVKLELNEGDREPPTLTVAEALRDAHDDALGDAVTDFEFNKLGDGEAAADPVGSFFDADEERDTERVPEGDGDDDGE